MSDFAELVTTTNFTFLTGASHPEEMVERAAELGLSAIAITDRNSVAGVVRAHVRLRELAREAAAANTPPGTPEHPPARKPSGVTPADVQAHAVRIRSQHRVDPSSRLPEGRLPAQGTTRSAQAAGSGPVTEPGAGPKAEPETGPVIRSVPRLITGARLSFTDTGHEVVALVRDRAAWARLCRLLTLGKRRAVKGECQLSLADLETWGEGLFLLILPPDPLGRGADADETVGLARRLARRFAGAVHLGAHPRYDGRDMARFDALAQLAAEAGVALAATAFPLMHRARRRRLADVLTCIRERLTVETLGFKALPNAERRLRAADEMTRFFCRHPDAVAAAGRIAAACRFSLDELSYDYPDEGDGESPQARLERLARAGLEWRYPDGVPAHARDLVERELALIGKLGYAPYFLTVHDIVTFARGRGILCQGRGSAANSVTCYALGITEISPETITMVFERFVSEARNEPPDIDVDFEHERREEVIQHIYERYGRHRAGLCATVIHFRARAAIREVGRAMGLSEDVTAALAGQVWGWSRESITPARLAEIGLDAADRRLMQTLGLVEEIIGFPRHLSQHVGGFVITAGRLDELVPVENAAMEERTVIGWDKDDIDALGILKVDVLSLGMLTCIRKAFDLLRSHVGIDHRLATLPPDCPKVYEMLCRADSLGVFQVESRAQMNFLPRMQPRSFYDLVIEVAIIRPGPIQGDMVHPYLRRRAGEEAVEFPSEELREVLGKTLGVPLFQEQAMRIAIVAAGFSADEADRLRRSLATFRRTGTVGSFRERFVGGMLARGYEPDFAERCFNQIEGFGEYGFPESHAASFALLVYASAWLKCHHPAIFACALLNAQPMGFYAPAQIVRDAREHGVEVRPVSVNHSHWDCTLEPTARGGFALRLGFRQIKGLPEEDGRWIPAARGNGYPDVESLWRRAGIGRRSIERLARADAFAAGGVDPPLSRREALWEARALSGDKPLPLFPEGEGLREPAARLPAEAPGEAVVEDYRALRLSLRAHPLALLREGLKGSARAEDLRMVSARSRVTVTGLVITRQRPGTASGVIFVTLEDETGVANVIVWPRVYQRFRRAVIAGRLLRVSGRLEREGAVMHLIAWRIEDLSARLDELGLAGPVSDGRGDEARRPVPGGPTAPGAGLPARATPRPRHPREQAKALFPSRDFH
ncbi:error-prone DNA polymerase [Limibaculum sp. M0105]|uniref:Error-prone DNA polymerase n=1 Tax=Thermohalobaculum xanthum TaxID=2753746 RepID=A0A8J7SCH3_9RHOB|nr:error-prone DNA polymerase [Thermohalobaculum xanthum]MBK0399422.1 error-prone DNA polymerase [Thermohalobaculum xanthum]